MTRQTIATVLQAIGATVVAAAFGLVWLPAGLAVAGVALVLFGLAAERDA